MPAAPPQFLYFDCAGTLMHPAEPIGRVYARTAAAFGIHSDPKEIQTRFRKAWKKALRPVYPHGPDENVDLTWWRKIVRESLLPAPLVENSRAINDPTLKSGSHGSSNDDHTGSGTGLGIFETDAFEDCFQTLFRHYARPDAWRLYPEVRPLLEALRGKVRMGVLSNFDARLYPLLDGHGLTPFFETIVISSESAACKPDPAIFTRAAAMAGNLPPEVILLAGDDKVNDWQGGAAAGWRIFPLRRPDNTLADLLTVP
ncbi:MAG: haloacid dehalogenase, family protein [Verrucomicrobiales bacterium]|nr:haloacid dehalogenase, family protein [Verrucomicrobiales bacterium]